MDKSKCSRCGGETVSGGLTQAKGLVENAKFHPDDAPFFSLVSSNIEVSARMCLDCGFIELWGDVDKARQVLRRDG